MDEKSYYIRLISTYDENDRYGYWLLELMNKYDKPNLMTITLDEARDFWNNLVKENEKWLHTRF